ncbi:MAG: MFS transporter [Burkholderiaceae bacterium]|nr:MFS transporter [Burkholderiaceae bacterium]
MNKNLALLTLCQGLFLTNNVVFIAINGLVGLELAPQGWMATLPVMGYVVGGALSTALVARSQALWGRKASFQAGLLVALLSALLCAWAAVGRQFWLLCAATVVAGYYNANAQLYRFAAVELAPPHARERAVSLVLAGGLIGAVAGPYLARVTRTLFAVPFAGAYLALVGVALLSMACMAGIRFPATTQQSTAQKGATAAAPAAGRSVAELLRAPAFAVAVLGAALGACRTLESSAANAPQRPIFYRLLAP